MIVVLSIIAGILILGMIPLYVWTRRSERDIDYVALEAESTQTDEQRRVKQVGIGLSWGQGQSQGG